jgi:hypothetical protein
MKRPSLWLSVAVIHLGIISRRHRCLSGTGTLNADSAAASTDALT